MSYPRVINLYVHVVHERRDGLITVDGRICEAALKLGDLFCVVFRYPLPESIEGFVHAREPLEQRHVSLRIKAMTAYGTEFEELDSGMTGRFELEGAGGELVRKDDILSSELVDG